jgi:ribosomal protein S19
MVGASVAGNTLPTNWNRQNSSGLTQTVVGVGVENGLQYVDINLSGIATGANDAYSYDNSITASISQTWTNSWYFKLVTSTPNLVRLAMQEFNGSTFLNVVTQDITPGTSLARYAQTKTLVGTGVNNVRAMIYVNFVIGQTYNTTIRLAAPQMELGTYATTFIKTSTAAVTRVEDAAFKTGVSSLIGQTEGTIFINVNNRILGQTNRYLFQVSDSTGSNSISVNYSSAQASTIRFFVFANGGNAALTFIVNTEPLLKLAVAYKNGVYRLFINGTLRYTQTGASFSSNLESVYLGVRSTLVEAIGEGINSFQVYKTELTNAQLAAITTL